MLCALTVWFLLARQALVSCHIHTDVQSRFDGLVSQADKLFHETRSLEVSIPVIRAALELCHTCKAQKQKDHLSDRVFLFDEFADRRLLSETIIPELANYSPKRILWVGVQSYTMRNLQYLKQLNASITSIEPDPDQAVFGANEGHIVAPLTELLEHRRPYYFDIIIINGVFGWGIDGEEATDAAVKLMFQAMQSNGLLVVGWNKGMGTCCNFEPYFHHRKLGHLGPILEVPDSETHHIFEFMRRNDRAQHLL